jgi:hypothetical protein
VLVLVLSPSFLASQRCQDETTSILEEIRRRKSSGGRVLVVEFDRVDPHRKSPELAGLKLYRFWVEDPATGRPQTLGDPSVRGKDYEYNTRLNDLCFELVHQLEATRQREPAALAPVPPHGPRPLAAFASIDQPGPDARPAVYLADVTEDLEPRWEAVRRHLDQAGFWVLPEAETPKESAETYRNAVDSDLARSVAFVQLLSETPGKRLKGSESRYVALQHERALAARKPVLQWRRRDLDITSEEIPEDHRRLLSGVQVVAADLSEFKSHVVETVKKLIAPPPQTHQEPEAGDTDKVVFINAEEPDMEAARQIIGYLSAHGLVAFPPVPIRGGPESIRNALRTRMLNCDGMVLVHGANPDWPVLQWTQFRKVKAERESQIRAIAICDLPPPDRPMTADDVLNLPSPLGHVINCREGLAAEKFATFLKAL